MQLSDLMHGYFDDQEKSGFDHPITNRVQAWEVVESPERLLKDYEFSSRQNALEFLRQLFLFEDAMNHHAKVSIENKNVRLEVYTHDIDKVTELDTDYAMVADQIFVDVEGEV